MNCQRVEIVCDESGWEGENVTGAAHRVLCHGSTDLKWAEAESLLAEIRQKFQIRGQEVKARRCLQTRERQKILIEQLSRFGLRQGRMHAYVVDKSYFVAAKFIDELVEEKAKSEDRDIYSDGTAQRLAADLFTYARHGLQREEWNYLRDLFVQFARVKSRRAPRPRASELSKLLHQARENSTDPRLTNVLDQICDADEYLPLMKVDLEENGFPSFDPLAPAVAETARHWVVEKRIRISLVHDRQSVFTLPRVATLQDVVGASIFCEICGRVPWNAQEQAMAKDFVDFRMVDSRHDPRVQVADLVAGLGRVLAQEAIESKEAQHLEPICESVYPMFGRNALWGDIESFRILTGIDLS